MNRLALFLLVVVWSFNGLQAQDSLNIEKIEVIKAYKPLLGDAIKTPFNPKLPKAKKKNKEVNYNIPTIPFAFEYQPQKIRAIAFPKSRVKPFTPNYIRAGFGSHVNTLFEYFHSSAQSKEHKYGILFTHNAFFGQHDTRNFNNNQLGVFGSRHFANFTLESDLNYSMNTINLHGTDSMEATPYTVNKFDGNISFYNHKENDALIDYRINLNGDVSGTDWDNESNFKSQILLTKSMSGSDNKITADLSYRMSNVNYDVASIKEPLYLINGKVKYEFNKADWKLHLGINPSFDQNNTLVLPELFGEKTIIKDKLYYYNGWTGGININSLRDIQAINPFIGSPDVETITGGPELPIITPYGIFNRSTLNNIKFTGVKGQINKYIDFDIEAKMNNARNLVFFTKDPNSNKFNVVTDDGDVLSLHTEVNYRNGKHYNLGLSVDYYSYNLDNEEQAWHMPSLQSTLRGSYNIQNKIFVDGAIFYRGTTYNKVENETQELKAVLDANLGFRYIYQKNLHFFMRMNNLAGIPYQRWIQYPSYGFHLMGGFSFSF